MANKQTTASRLTGALKTDLQFSPMSSKSLKSKKQFGRPGGGVRPSRPPQIRLVVLFTYYIRHPIGRSHK